MFFGGVGGGCEEGGVCGGEVVMGCNILAFNFVGHGNFGGHGRQKPIHLRQDHALHRQA